MMRSVSRRAMLGAALAAGLPAFAQTAAPVADEVTGAARTQALNQASAAMNAVRRLQGRFTQLAPGGQISTGQFYMQRPGRLRFAYDPPAALLIVADGTVLAVQDTALRSVNRAPLRSSPLYFVLKENINLARDVRVTSVRRRNGALLISARDRSGGAEGEITLALAGPDLILRAWDVVDATGARTRLTLTDLTQPASFDPRLFRAPLPPPSLRGTRP